MRSLSVKGCVFLRRKNPCFDFNRLLLFVWVRICRKLVTIFASIMFVIWLLHLIRKGCVPTNTVETYGSFSTSSQVTVITADQPLGQTLMCLGKTILGYDGRPAYWDNIHEMFRYELVFFVLSKLFTNTEKGTTPSCLQMTITISMFLWSARIQTHAHTHTHTHTRTHARTQNMYLEYLSDVAVLFCS